MLRAPSPQSNGCEPSSSYPHPTPHHHHQSTLFVVHGDNTPTSDYASSRGSVRGHWADAASGIVRSRLGDGDRGVGAVGRRRQAGARGNQSVTPGRTGPPGYQVLTGGLSLYNYVGGGKSPRAVDTTSLAISVNPARLTWPCTHRSWALSKNRKRSTSPPASPLEDYALPSPLTATDSREVGRERD